MHEIKISQLGEGLTEIRVVALLQKEGTLVNKDQPLLEVETDKAMMVIETPHGGRLQKWLVEEGETVSVGSTVALIAGQTEDQIQISDPKPKTETPITPMRVERVAQTRNRDHSPRERAKLNFPPAPPSTEISARQERLGQLFVDSQHYIAEASITMRVPWDGLAAACHQLKGLEGLEYRPTPAELIGWSIIQALKEHPRFRTLNRGAQGYQSQEEICIGNAVGLPDDGLAIASVSHAASLDLGAFINSMRRSVAEIRAGRSTPGRCQLILSYMAQHNVWIATPRLLLPAVSTLFVGMPYEVPVKADDGSLEWQRLANFVLTFDHRIINGVGAAAFLNTVIGHLEKLP